MNQLDAVAVGEGQLRLAPPSGTSLAEARDLRMDVAGTEGNVLGLLSRLGLSTGLITSLPDNQLGVRVADEYRQAGIDLTRTVWRDEGRVGLYFVDPGSPPVPSRVLYDRKESVFSRMTSVDIDWDYLDEARLVHSTGITAALGDGPRGILERIAEPSAGRLRSVDVNFRSLLWSPQAARAGLTPLLQGADVVFCSRRDAATVFGIEGSTEGVAAAFASRFDVNIVAISDGPYPVHIHAEGRRLSATPPRTAIVDRVGAGDAFIGGFLSGVLGDDLELGLRRGIAAAALALTRHGDQLHTTPGELEWVIDSMESGTDIVR